MRKIVKYSQFIKENFEDTPETYIATALKQIQQKISSLFDEGKEDAPEDKVETMSDAQQRGKKEQRGEKMSFRDLGLHLDDTELSKYSKQYDSVTFKFSDQKYRYDLYVMIKLEDAIPKEEDKDKDFSWKDIENCYVKFKKYEIDKDFELIGQISKTIKIKELDEDKLIELKIELDKDFGGDEDELQIET